MGLICLKNACRLTYLAASTNTKANIILEQNFTYYNLIVNVQKRYLCSGELIKALPMKHLAM